VSELVAERFPVIPDYAERFPAIGGIFILMVTQDMISPVQLKAGMKATRHKYLSLAAALKCSERSLRNFARGRTRTMYAVQVDDLKRELHLDQAA
jgi:hypothetical protein